MPDRDLARVHLRELWTEHLASSFPPSARGKEVGSIDLVLLDADVAGYVDSAVREGNTHPAIDPEAVASLAVDLDVVLLTLTGDSADYFQAVRRMCHALREVL
ncbi:hypothetical protein R8Z50_35360 [Longispora sp. K20-0274]|uniref:hypothetical protein n=1 Tax=Longispora sp. K20-0274 TaxID=3088255 RepID=UPI003999695C